MTTEAARSLRAQAFRRRRHERLPAGNSEPEHPWEHGGRVVTAITFATLVKERLDPTSLGAIDGSWLAIARG